MLSINDAACLGKALNTANEEHKQSTFFYNMPAHVGVSPPHAIPILRTTEQNGSKQWPEI